MENIKIDDLVKYDTSPTNMGKGKGIYRGIYMNMHLILRNQRLYYIPLDSEIEKIEKLSNKK
jgi:hypothetical protein